MSHLDNAAAGWQSLAQRLAQGRMPAGEALRIASLMAESLRKSHEEGRVHGHLTPSVIWLNGPAVEVTPPLQGPRALTPYTAPELLTGRAADCRSDIFSFGAILYEMLAGRRAFGGETQASLVQSLRNSQPASSGSIAADKLLAGCLAKDPAQRWHQIHKVDLELKLLSVAVRKAERRAHAAPAEPESPAVHATESNGGPHLVAPVQPAASQPAHAAPVFASETPGFPSGSPYFAAPETAFYPPASEYAALRSEMQQSETRILSARMQMSERAMADLHRAVADAVTGLRSQLSTLTTQIGGVDRSSLGLFGAEAVSDGAVGRLDKTLQAFASRLETIERAVAVIDERVQRSEQEAEAAKQQVNVLHSAMAEDFVTFEQSLHKQEKTVDSTRTAMAQTDDLVERLVEALEALQTTVMERPVEYSAVAVN